MYVDRSSRGDPKKYNLIDELNFKKIVFKEKYNNQVICCYYIKKKRV